MSGLKLLFVGDVVGRPGRLAVTTHLPALISKYQTDFVVVNGENAAAGYGVSKSTLRELLDAGADCITTGNHVWAQKEVFDLLTSQIRLLRPANFPPGAPGVGCRIYPLRDGRSIAVINLLGRVFMDAMECPFRMADRLIAEVKDTADVILVDFHAEATSEKIAMGYYLDGRISALIGTHTHVQTADETILPEGTAYISDAGMTGPIGTVIGVKKEIVIQKFLTGLPARFEVPKDGPAKLSAILVTIADYSGKATAIERIQVLTDICDAV